LSRTCSTTVFEKRKENLSIIKSKLWAWINGSRVTWSSFKKKAKIAKKKILDIDNNMSNMRCQKIIQKSLYFRLKRKKICVSECDDQCIFSKLENLLNLSSKEYNEFWIEILYAG
jgi:hypothetical protein